MILCYEKLGLQNKAFFDSIKLLLNRSKGGVVEHPMLDSSKKRPIWALYGVAIALSSILPDDDSNKLIVVCCNHVYRLPSAWPIRLLLKIINRWVLSVALITFIVNYYGGIIVLLWKNIYNYLIAQVSPNWATLCMSVCTSIIATAIIDFSLVFRKKVLS